MGVFCPTNAGIGIGREEANKLVKLSEKLRSRAGGLQVSAKRLCAAEEAGDLTCGARARGRVFTTDANSAKFFEQDCKEAVADEGAPRVASVGGVGDGAGLARGDLGELRVGAEHLEEDTLVVEKSQGPSARAMTELSGKRLVVVVKGAGDAMAGAAPPSTA